MSDLPAWYCDDHGLVLHAAITQTPFEVSSAWFCTVCGRELHRGDVLSEIEGPRAASFEEWKEAQNVPVLEIKARRRDCGEDSA